MRLARGDAQAAFERAPHTVKGELYVGGQEQFYLEGQIAYAIPQENDGMLVQCSTQHPSEMQHVVAHALGLHSHHVVVECRRMGGGFGGKESQSALWAAAAAISARLTGRAVKLRADRDDDMLVTGKRHCFHYEYEVGYDGDGRIVAAKVDMVSRAGYSADLSGPVATRAVCHFDNTYYLSDVDIRAACGKTNTQSNTAFRGFGGPQGAIAMEYVLDEIARNLGRDALDIRKLNFYGKEERNVTPYGQVIVDNVIHELVDELEATSEYRARRAAIDAFNAASPVLKKGPGAHAGQIRHRLQRHPPEPGGRAGARVRGRLHPGQPRRHRDGAGRQHQGDAGGGARAGRGLGARAHHRHQYQQGRQHLGHRGVHRRGPERQGGPGRGAPDPRAPGKLRRKQHGGAVEHVRFAADTVFVNGRSPVRRAGGEGLSGAGAQLWSDGYYATPGLSWDPKTMTGRPFSYFAYGAAVSEVIVDTLTGEWKLLRADALYDAGKSLNPAIDIGQVEGAFIQGMGWLTTEELWWNDGGKLMTHAPSTYKIPAMSDCPEDFRVRLFENRNVEDSIHRSKAVGEPPLLLPFSVFFAIRDAISSVGGHKVNPPLNAPATCEAILDAVAAVEAATSASA
jgi:xanthine dehydrogenase large subunit